MKNNKIDDQKFEKEINDMINKLNENLSLKTNFEKVISFHEKAKIFPSVKINTKLKDLRIKLMTEEFNEYIKAEEEGNLKHILKEIADIIYIAYGTSYCYNHDMNVIFDKVHKSNLSKVASNIKKDKNGKIIKNEDYKKAELNLEDSKIL
jgi:predicted HAD superfamily Cof-like phosphohydrolase